MLLHHPQPTTRRPRKDPRYQKPEDEDEDDDFSYLSTQSTINNHPI
jgi:hypothetical protein